MTQKPTNMNKKTFNKTRSLVAGGLLLIGGSFTIMSFTHKPAEAKPKSEAATTSVAKEKVKDAFTYYVTGVDNDGNYTLSTSGSPCGDGTNPCRITSENELGNSVPQSTVDNQEEGITIVERRNGY